MAPDRLSAHGSLIAENLIKDFEIPGQEPVRVLRDLNLTIESGEIVAITGASGSGKSTLLHVLAGLDQADEGRIQLLGQSLTDLSARDLAVFRNQKLGFVYQFHHLMAELSVLENVALPALIKGLKKTEANHQAKTLLKEVGLNHRLQHFPWQLSGGERQRCAIARALINQPSMLFADEPTGNLDHVAAEQASSLLIALSKDRGATVVLVTHNMSLAAKADRVLNLHEGRLS